VSVSIRRARADDVDFLVELVTQVWKRALLVLAEVIERGVASGEFEPCDPWLSASVVWVGANAVIQTLEVPERRALWERDVPLVFHEAVELFLRGLAKR